MIAGDTKSIELVDDAVSIAIKDQLDAGLDVITDGEQTRLDFNLSFYGFLQGIELESASPRRFGPPAHDQRGKHRVVGELKAPRGLGTVVATLTIDFHHEIRAGQLVLIRGAVTRVGTKSFAHEMRLFEADAMTHCATQKTVEVCFDTAARKGVALPEDVRSRLQGICVI